MLKYVIRGGVKLCDNVRIRPSSELYCTPRNARLIMRNNVEIGNHSTISALHEVILEDGVLTGPHVFIADHNHNYQNPYVHIYKQGTLASNDSCVHIGEGTWLGTNVVIVGNIRVGKHCVIGANSVVTKSVPDYSVAVGIPAKVIKRYDFDKREWIRV